MTRSRFSSSSMKLSRVFMISILITLSLLLTANLSFAQLSGSISDQINVSCFGESDGSVTLIGENGTPPYEYKIDGGEYQESGLFENLAAGTYAFIVRDNNQDTFVINVTITEPTILSIVLNSKTNVACSDDVDGTIDITASGGIPPYTFFWTTDDGSGLEIGTEDQTGLTAGTYLVELTDANGCTQTLSTLIELEDITPPDITGGADGTAECTGSHPMLNEEYILWRDGFAGITASDNCGIASVSFDENVWVIDGCTAKNTVVFVAVDNSGLSNTVSFTFSITDTTPPLIIGGEDGSADSEGSDPGQNPEYIAWKNNFAGAAVTDICGTATLSYTEGPWISDDFTDEMTLTIVGTDECGLSSIMDFTFIINKIGPPVISCPGPLFLECYDDVPAADTSLVTATDNCTGNPTITFISDVSDGNTCPEIITRTYRATDECGYFTECTQLITIQDITPPVISCPGPINIECIGDLPAPDVTLITASDNCTPAPIITFVSDVSDGNICPEAITRTYIATDDCGNNMECTQLITIMDETPPMITCPPDITISCMSELPEADYSILNAVDNCLSMMDFFHEDYSDGKSCPETIIRSYAVADECGNIGVCEQIITIEDLIPPILIGVPEDITVECDSIPDPPEVSGLDECNPESEVTVTYEEFKDSLDNCSGVLIRLWTAIDECGNIGIGVQSIIVNPSTGIEKIEGKPSILVYPNPNNGAFNFEYTSGSLDPVRLLISDISGRVIFDQQYQNPSYKISEIIQIPECTPGIYYMRITSDSEITYRKIIIE